MNLVGPALLDQAKRTKSEAGKQLLNEALIVFKKALEVCALEQSTNLWFQTQSGLATTYYSLRDKRNAAESRAGITYLFVFCREEDSAPDIRQPTQDCPVSGDGQDRNTTDYIHLPA